MILLCHALAQSGFTFAASLVFTKSCARHVPGLWIMPQLIVKDGKMIRISPKNKRRLEVSTNNGGSWMTRCVGAANTGEFLDLVDNGTELIATTENGLFFSTNNGESWIRRN